MTVDEVHQLTRIDPWFLQHLVEIVEIEEQLRGLENLETVRDELLREAKQCGFSDRQLSTILSTQRDRGAARAQAAGDRGHLQVGRYLRRRIRSLHALLLLDLRGRGRNARAASGQKRIMILGGGPNRIGQGIEFDYCCCHASFALREMGIQSIMVNSNPETVSTDYDTSDLLFFEPLTTEDVLNICDRVQPDGVIVQFGGQTPLNLARALSSAGVPIIGTSVDTIEDAEDREKFQQLLMRLGLKQPANGIARTMAQARAEAAKIGYPALVRPSFVLGGRAMEICYDQSQLERFVAEAFIVAQGQPVLIDRFLEDAIEVDVDAISDGHDVVVAGIMEHIEEAGIHSGDSACVDSALQPARPDLERDSRSDAGPGPQTSGCGTDEHSVRDQERGRTSEPVRAGSEPAGQPHGAVCFEGHGHASGQDRGQGHGRHDAGRAGLRPRADSQPRVDQGERVSVPQVRGRRHRAGPRNALDRRGDGHRASDFRSLLPRASWRPARCCPKRERSSSASPRRPRNTWCGLAKRLAAMGFKLMATEGTARRLEEAGIDVQRVNKLQEGHPNLLDYLVDGEIQLIMNTPSGKGARTDEGKIRSAAVARGVPCITTIQAADAAVRAMEALRDEEITVQALQDRFESLVSRK